MDCSLGGTFHIDSDLQILSLSWGKGIYINAFLREIFLSFVEISMNLSLSLGIFYWGQDVREAFSILWFVLCLYCRFCWYIGFWFPSANIF